jgi:hypothetical protein
MAACEHIPVIIHRTGGIPADRKNVCGRCGETCGGSGYIVAKGASQ